MSLLVVKPGLQTTIQGAPFSGHRHIGMPAAGAADCLSLALANHLAGQKYNAAALEITLDEAQFIAQEPCIVVVSGATSSVQINGIPKALNSPLRLETGDKISVASAAIGCRSYLAINKSLITEHLLENESTYMTAGLGGFHGRALQSGDILEWTTESLKAVSQAKSFEKYSQHYSNNFILRITAGPELEMLAQHSITALSSYKFKIGNRANRMGMELTGFAMQTEQTRPMLSAPVFPGTIQCPPDGIPFLLGPDAQTTGGYPRIAQVIRADRHLIGQLRPGSAIQFVRVLPERATQIYREKLALLKPLFSDISLW